MRVLLALAVGLLLLSPDLNSYSQLMKVKLMARHVEEHHTRGPWPTYFKIAPKHNPETLAYIQYVPGSRSFYAYVDPEWLVLASDKELMNTVIHELCHATYDWKELMENRPLRQNVHEINEICVIAQWHKHDLCQGWYQ